ncbi:predicted protein [Naegleria gruberi]|uniref:Predicted protein n=1 Tax=Naegleria gruberi TaxID=5762 RepID=D2W0V7_NAEGR|nr:uncharacterized protein NAEGRDRAFT_74996 [Naegleria gruberi]EFC37248.1 predicted protein [Naegleria gruberi]|eukprot:XP_002669992.1 predicted protein [Naegleria gruberi strain NEG-M]
MPPANSSTPQNISSERCSVVNRKNKSSSSPSEQHMTQHATNQVQQNLNGNWMTDVSSDKQQHMYHSEDYANNQSVKYSLSTTTIGFGSHEVTCGSNSSHPPKKKYKFKNNELVAFQQSTDAKKTSSQKHATCHQHYVITSQKSLDLDDYSQDYMQHAPFKLMDLNEKTLHSTTIIQINQNDLNRRLTTLKRGADSISKEDILRVLHLNQQQASSRLGCSVSTLKRRFYALRGELGLTKWPNNYIDSCQDNTKLFKQIYPLSLDYILNSD